MKTIKIIAAIGLALMIFGISAAWAKGGGSNKPINPDGKPGLIRYSVTVHLSDVTSHCNTYWVEITDHTGRAVAPPQTYIPGKSIYNFYEQGPQTGARIARFILHPNRDNLVCKWVLFALPDIKYGTFEGGESYAYDLYPMHYIPKH